MKKSLSIILSLLMVFSAFSSFSVSAYAESETPTTGSGTETEPWVVYSWAALKEKMALGGYIKLGEDVEDTVHNSDSGLSVPGGKTVFLDLNGCLVDRALTSKTRYGYVIYVGGTLNITDSSGDNSGTITRGYGNRYSDSGVVFDGGGFFVNGGELNIYGGTVSGNIASAGTSSSRGGGIYAVNATVNMYDGVITGNRSYYCGGGVALENSTFHMYGGFIINNQGGKNGGGVAVTEGSTFIFDNGTISENYAGTGGGVYVYDSASSFTMNGGSITKNTTNKDDYNTGQGAGVYVGNDVTFNLFGGSITENTGTYWKDTSYATELGAGVFFSGSGFSVKGKPVVTGNVSLNRNTDYSTTLPCNVYVLTNQYGDQRINIAGALEEGASLGVTSAEYEAEITAGFNTYNSGDEPSSFFKSDRTGYKVIKNGSGEAEIKQMVVREITFNNGGGSGSMDPVKVEDGSDYTLPSSTSFTKEGRRFYGWKNGDNYYDASQTNTVTITGDTEFTAVWYSDKTVDIRNDRSTSEVEGSIKITDTRTGEVYTDILYDEVTSSLFTDPSNPSVEVMIKEAKDALAAAAKAKAGSYAITVIKDGEISLSTKKTIIDTNPRTVPVLDPSLGGEYPAADSSGDLIHYTFLEGEMTQRWKYAVTYEAEYASEAPAEPEPVLSPEDAALPTEEKTEEEIKKTNTDKKDVAGSSYAPLKLKATSKGKTVTLKWSAQGKADGYIIYGAPCGKKMTRLATIANGKTAKYTFKKLKKGKYYKYIVVAYKKTAIDNRVIAKSKSVHIATPGGKKGNPTGISVKTKMTVKKGKKVKIKAKLLKKGKVATHIAKLRYESSNAKVASVDKNGYLKAKKKGTVTVYVYTQNGIAKTIKVKVK